MARKIPPLGAVRAFEAAARLKSVSRAADELAVTQGAVSHQIRAPVVRRDRRRERFPSFRRLALLVQGHGEDEAGGGAEHLRGVTLHCGDCEVEPPLAVFRQPLSEPKVGISPRKLRSVNGHGLPGERDGLTQLILRRGQEQTRPGDSLRSERTQPRVRAEPGEQVVAFTTVFLFPAEK